MMLSRTSREHLLTFRSDRPCSRTEDRSGENKQTRCASALPRTQSPFSVFRPMIARNVAAPSHPLDPAHELRIAAQRSTSTPARLVRTTRPRARANTPIPQRICRRHCREDEFPVVHQSRETLLVSRKRLKGTDEMPRYQQLACGVCLSRKVVLGLTVCHHCLASQTRCEVCLISREEPGKIPCRTCLDSQKKFGPPAKLRGAKLRKGPRPKTLTEAIELELGGRAA